MIKLTLPFWNNKGSSALLIQIGQKFWEKIEASLRWPLTQTDPDTCTLAVLNLLAWQRDITRIKAEPTSLYRARVKYAYVNAADAGSIVGIKRIFVRLGVGYIEVEERTADRDWDVIILRLTDGQLAGNADLLRSIIEMYGRTCRRYEFQVISPVVVSLATAEFGNTFGFDVAKQNSDVLVFSMMVAAQFENEFAFDVAKGD